MVMSRLLGVEGAGDDVLEKLHGQRIGQPVGGQRVRRQRVRGERVGRQPFAVSAFAVSAFAVSAFAVSAFAVSAFADSAFSAIAATSTGPLVPSGSGTTAGQGARRDNKQTQTACHAIWHHVRNIGAAEPIL